MNTEKIIELLFYTLPALITGGIAYFLFYTFFKSEENRRRFELLKANQKQALPIRLQAYERIVLFLERMHPAQLLLRVAPPSTNKNDYATLLIHAIQTEFEHNLAQQIYITDASWEMVNKAKNTTVQMIRKMALQEDSTDANQMREAVLLHLTENTAPSSVAIDFVKNELKSVL